MSKIQEFLQRIVGIKKDPGIQKTGNYLSFTEAYRYFQDTNQETLLKSYRSWVYAAVSKRADEFSAMKLTLNRITGKGENRKIVPVKEHAVLELLDKVNPFLSFPDLLKITQIYKDLTGNAYWWIIKNGNTITEIWPYLRPDRVSIIPSAVNFIEGYNYLVPDRGTYVKFDVDEIIHFKYPNPLDPYIGVSPMEACYLAFNTYQKSSEYNNRFFKNNARADFILNIENPLSDTERKQLLTQWENRHKGEGHEYRMGIVSGGKASVLTTGMSAKDMEFIEQQKFTRDEILAIFKVPKALLDPQELNYASARVAKEVFLNEVIVPLMSDFIQTLNEFLLPQYNDDSLFFDFIHPGEEDPEQKNAWIQSRIQARSISPNEIRAMDNLPPFEGGDVIYGSAMDTPIGEAPQNQEKRFIIGRVKNVELPQKYHMQIKSKSEIAEIRNDVEKNIREKMSEDVKKKKLAETKQKKETILPREIKAQSPVKQFREAVWNAKIAKTNVDERDMRKLLSEQFNRQQKHVLNSLHEKSFSFDWDDEGEDGIFIKVFNPFIKEIVVKYGEDAMGMVDIEKFTLSDRAKNWIEDNVKNFSGEINNTTKEKIRIALATAVENGEGVPEAAKRIKTVFTEANTSRAHAIARTEILHSSNYASVEAWKQSDVVSGKEWLTAFDEATCEVCSALDGKTRGLEDNFNNSDDLFGDAPEPPAHVNCRCTLLPILKTKSAIIGEIKQTKNELEKTIEDVREKGEKEIAEIKDIKEKLNKVLEDG